MAPKRHLTFSAESPTRVGGSKRRCCCCHEQVYSLKEFMEKLDPPELQLVEQMCQKHQINIVPPSSRKRKYRLLFRNNLPEKLFTTKKLSENNIEVEIVDAANEIIRSGPMATAEVEIVVLHEDFDGDKNVEWTEEEFKKHLVVPRNKKLPLLEGNLVKLCDGVGCISGVKFKDNSSWGIGSTNFRLGVKVLGEMAEEVVEGISTAFRVFHRQMLKCQKDRPLLLNDEVCCLKGISKKGPLHTKLVEKNIKTVWDFLCYCDNQPPDTLRVMLGMGKGKWKTTYDHAMQSKSSSDTQLYSPLNLPAPDQVDESISPMNSLPSNGSWKGTEHSETFRYIWLKIYFIVRLKSAAQRSKKSRCFETSPPRHNAYEQQLGDFSPFRAYENNMDQCFDWGQIDLDQCFLWEDYNDLCKW